MKRVKNKELEKLGVLHYKTQSLHDFRKFKDEVSQTPQGILVTLLGQYDLTLDPKCIGEANGRNLYQAKGYLKTRSLDDRLDLIVTPQTYRNIFILLLEEGQIQIREPQFIYKRDRPDVVDLLEYNSQLTLKQLKKYIEQLK